MIWRIYKITCTVNGKVYIGQTTQSVHDRWIAHCDPRSNCKHLKAAIVKHGRTAFSVEQIVSCKTLEDTHALERQLIAEHRSNDRERGYNLTIGGEGQPRRFCKNGHDMDIVGRYGKSGCKACNKIKSAENKARLKNDPLRAERVRLWNKAYMQKRRQDPEYVAEANAHKSAYQKMKRRTDPEWVARKSEKDRLYKQRLRAQASA